MYNNRRDNMISKTVYNLYGALQVTLNVNMKIWESNGIEFTPESVLPLQLLSLKKRPHLLKILTATALFLTRYLYPGLYLVLFFQLLKASVLLPFRKKRARLSKLEDTLLFYGSGRLFQTYASSGRDDKCTIFCVSGKTATVPPEFSGCPQVLFWDLISFSDIWKCCGPLCALIKLQKRHRRSQYVMLQALELLLVEKALQNYPGLRRIVFCNADRWSYICTALKGCEKIFMQHGLFSAKLTPVYFSHKWQEVSLFYGYANEQAEIISSCIRKFGAVSYFKPQLSLSPLRHSDSRSGVLLICCSTLFLEKEIEIIKQYASDPEFALYVKPHPVHPQKPYTELMDRYDFILINEKDYFPDVDLVIAYSSTLAYEYQLCGKKVIIHSEW